MPTTNVRYASLFVRLRVLSVSPVPSPELLEPVKYGILITCVYIIIHVSLVLEVPGAFPTRVFLFIYFLVICRVSLAY